MKSQLYAYHVFKHVERVFQLRSLIASHVFQDITHYFGLKQRIINAEHAHNHFAKSRPYNIYTLLNL